MNPREIQDARNREAKAFNQIVAILTDGRRRLDPTQRKMILDDVTKYLLLQDL